MIHSLAFRLPIDTATAKRAAKRMVASVAVMSALSAVSREEPRDVSPFHPMVRADVAEPPATPAIEVADDKTDRLQRRVQPREAAVVLAKAEPRQKDGVIFFDRCRPACESRDPLLTRRSVTPVSPPEILNAVSVVPEPELVEAIPVSVPRGGMLGAMSSGLSLAAQSGRAIVGEAGRLLSF